MPFGSLWLPVVLSAVGVFVISSILHMALKYHRADHKQLPNEPAVRDAFAKANPAPGVYFTPYCADHSQLNDPAIKQLFEKGPVATVTILPNGAPNMGKLLGLWFVYSLLVSFVSAYVARHALSPGADGMLVMRTTGTVAFAAYALAHISDSIWKGQPWASTARAVFDGVIYAVVTASAFCLLWPAA